MTEPSKQMTLEESRAEATRILRAAGWRPVSVWKGAGRRVANGDGLFAYENLVGGITPDGRSCHMKDWSQVQRDDPDYGVDTPDEPHEAARWLVEHYLQRTTAQESSDAMPFSMPAYLSADRYEASDEAPVFESQTPGCAPEPVADSVGRGASDAADEGLGGASNGTASGGGALQSYHGQDGAGDSEREYAFDADYEEVGEELGAELLADDAFNISALAGAAIDAPPQNRFYGLDDLDRRRSLRIGDVVRFSRVLQEAIWQASGTTEAAYEHLVSQVMRDTRDGVYVGPREAFAQFNDLQTWANQAAAVRREEGERVAFLTNPETTREQIEAFDPEAGWPEV